MSRNPRRYGMAVILGGLVILHFGLAPWWPDRRIAPDLVLLALIIVAMRSRPGNAALAGFLVGLASDSVLRVNFGAGAMAYTVVGYLASWGRAVFFAENLMVNAVFFFSGSLFRDILMIAAGGMGGAGLWQIALWSVLKGITTALVGVLVLMAFSNWINIRIAD